MEKIITLEELIQHRRFLHACPEIGFELEKSASYIFHTLESYGITPVWMEHYGIQAIIGNPTKPCILFRADMDALPMKEESNLPFASTNGNMHSCGHDLHMSMLLGAAKMFKENEHLIDGCIKLMFQPNEESVKGAKEMIQQGILENPKVEAAFALHVETGKAKTHTLQYRTRAMSAASDILHFECKGKSAHGAMPYQGVDVIQAGILLYQNLQSIVARELDAFHPTVLTIGQFSAGSAHNILPEDCILKGSLRTFDEKDRTYILERIGQICKGIEQSNRVSIKFTIVESVDSIRNDESLIDWLYTSFPEYPLEERDTPWVVSEDFCWIANEVPSAFLTLSAGSKEEGYRAQLHNSKIIFNEECLLTGAMFFYDIAKAYFRT